MEEKKPLYTPEDIAGLDYRRDLGCPGEYPFTRGVQADMYRGRTWTMRQFAGFGTAGDTNQRYTFLLDRGTTGPFRRLRHAHHHGLRLRPPHERGRGRPVRRGDRFAAVDMEALFDGIPLGRYHHLR